MIRMILIIKEIKLAIKPVKKLAIKPVKKLAIKPVKKLAKVIA